MQEVHQDPQTQSYAPGQYVDPRAQLTANVERFMASVYAWMALAVLVTAGVSGAIASSPAAIEVLYGIDVLSGTRTGTGLQWVALFAPLIYVWIVGGRIPQMRGAKAQVSLLVYAALIGVALSYVPLIYSAASISGVFIVTAGMFGAMSAFGYFTKKDLTGMGRFLGMAAMGLFIAWMVSLIFPAVYFWISAIGVFVFAGLTAYHTQNIKQHYLVNGRAGNLAVVGALMLYVSFVNMFLFMLHLFGGRD